MSSSEYEDREQTAVKHEVLERYLSGFVPIVGAWASDITYIDCLAGPWESVDPEFHDTSFARAVSVLRKTRKLLTERGKSPTMRCLFIENDIAAFANLKQYCDGISDIEVTPKSWDFTERIEDIVKFARERNSSFPFVFIDPKGWKPLSIQRIKPILNLNPGEVLINLMTSWITRFLALPEKRFDLLVGKDWPKLAGLSGEEKEEKLVSSYADALREAGGFKYICTLPVMKPTQDAFHFHLIYGTRHIKGVEVFKETEKYVIPFMHDKRAQAQERKRFSNSAQYSLLPPADSYKETRFTRYRIRNLEVARRELWENLQTSRTLPYEDAWAMVMQHSAVTERDLREWLAAWESEGLLEITNKRPGQKFPRKGSGQGLKWIQGATK